MRGLWACVFVTVLGALPTRAEAQFFFEDFDGYATGSTIAGQGGWEVYTAGHDTIVTAAESLTPPNSLLDADPADILHRFSGIDSGLWYAKAMTYVPSTQNGEMWFILFNTYPPQSEAHWSVQVVLCANGCTSPNVQPGTVVNFGRNEIPGGGTLPLITDQWVEVRAEVNLTANTYSVFYGDTLLDTRQYTLTGALEIQAIDFWSNGSTESYIDNVWIDTTQPVELLGFSVS